MLDLIGGQNAILFDGDCMYCSDFARVMSLRSTLGSLQLVNLRDHAELNTRLRELGFEPNEGMMFKHGTDIYYGADAVHVLSVASKSSGLWGVLAHFLFKNPARVRAVYPLMKLGRRITLMVRGRKLIQ